MNQLISQATFGGVTIPASQALPPAGFDQVAFRPACPQVVPVGQANGLTAWTLPMPDGANLTLLELEPMSEAQAHMTLDSYGLCKVGGDPGVPILYSRQLPQRSFAAPVVEARATDAPTPPADLAPADAAPQSGGIGGVLAGSVVLVVLALWFISKVRGQPKPLGAGPAGPTTKAAPPKAKTLGRNATRRSQLDDLLGGDK
jgi:hypothetical protein